MSGTGLYHMSKHKGVQMKVGTYFNHHFLPFWHHPQNPNWMFNPSVLGDWTFTTNGETGGKLTHPAIEHWVIPILNGLFNLDLRVMAHVSIIFNSDDRTIETPKRVWVQISTEPREWKEGPTGDIPVVLKDGKIQVEHLWGKDNGTYNPFGLLERKLAEESSVVDNPEFWTEFFLQKLREANAKANQEMIVAVAKASQVAGSYWMIP